MWNPHTEATQSYGAVFVWIFCIETKLILNSIECNALIALYSNSIINNAILAIIVSKWMFAWNILDSHSFNSSDKYFPFSLLLPCLEKLKNHAVKQNFYEPNLQNDFMPYGNSIPVGAWDDPDENNPYAEFQDLEDYPQYYQPPCQYLFKSNWHFV